MGEGAVHEVLPGRRHIIKRPRLTRLLDECEARIILLVAPAGYGKTMLAREWLSSRPSACVQCDDAVRDVAALALRLVESASELVPRPGAKVATRLALPGRPDADIDGLAELILDELAACPPEAWLFVDDAHEIGDGPASQLLEGVVTRAHFNVLIATRRRPPWATAKRLVYGDFQEIGRAALAMDDDEARAVFTARGTRALPGLLRLVDGWPALLGLAAVAGDLVNFEGDLPDDLHDYFAEELFACADPVLRSSLLKLSLAPRADPAIVRALLGQHAPYVLEEGARLGFMPSEPRGELHPLLRRFLNRKVQGHDDYPMYLAQVVQTLRATSRWVDLVALAEREEDVDLFVEALGAAADDLLKAGQLSTLNRWLSIASDFGIDAPKVDVVAGELALREGTATKAALFSERALAKLDPDDPDIARALILAGRSFYLKDEYDTSLRYFGAARARSTSGEELQHALWGAFLCVNQLVEPGARQALDAFIEAADESPESALRVAVGEMIYAEAAGSFVDVLDRTEATVHLLPRARDPLARSSFLNGRARLLALAGRYEDAAATVELELREVRDYGLAFAYPSAFGTRAIALAGRGDFAGALSALVQTDETARRLGDLHNQVDALAIRMRVLLAMGRVEDAVRLGEKSWSRAAGPIMWAELLACRAIALACLGDFLAAQAEADRAEATCNAVQARVLANWARALASPSAPLRRRREAIVRAFEGAIDAGYVDSLVTAYRTAPSVLDVLADSDLKARVHDVIAGTGDVIAARRLGIQTPTKSIAAPLTPREAEVYALLVAGLSNKEIAARLFISPVTVKVHVRHIFEKLGVRTRVEAAVRGAAPSYAAAEIGGVS